MSQAVVLSKYTRCIVELVRLRAQVALATDRFDRRCLRVCARHTVHAARAWRKLLLSAN